MPGAFGQLALEGGGSFRAEHLLGRRPELGAALFQAREHGSRLTASLGVKQLSKLVKVDPLDFTFDGGRLCLDFVGTRGRRGHRPIERLRAPEDLVRWFLEAGLGERPPAVTPLALRRAHELREAIYGALHEAMAGRTPERRDVRAINAAARRTPPAPQLDASGRRVRWAGSWGAGLALVARDAVDLLASDRIDRVRECAASDCTLLFLDESRAGRRRWCTMARCGNRAKAAGAYRRRRHVPDPACMHP